MLFKIQSGSSRFGTRVLVFFSYDNYNTGTAMSDYVYRHVRIYESIDILVFFIFLFFLL